MCERKPGPRCSADTFKVLQKAETDYLNIAEEFAAEEVRLIDLPDIDTSDADYDKYNALSRRFKDAEQAREDAQLHYNSTPNGLKLLLADSETTEVRDIEDYALTTWAEEDTGWDEGGVDYGPETVAVNFKVPVAELIKGKHLAASEHREWQQTVSKLLAEDENNDPAKALFIAQGFRETVQDEVEEHRNGKQRFVYESALTEHFHGQNSKTEQELVKSYVKYLTVEVMNDYNKLKIKDLDSYISFLRKRIADEGK